MSTAIERMLESYEVETIYDQKNAMKEIMQEIVLCGLSRAGFFKKAAFYGGTALRIFYDLDRFSEDLDFSLIQPDPGFSLKDYFPILEKEVAAFGIRVDIQEKEKHQESAIQSAFLKGNTREHLLLFYADEAAAGNVAANEMIKIKFEVDINPPAYASFEHKYRLLPVPYEVKIYDLPSLFAGKIHAVLCRGWKSRVKGRDLYDYVFYLSKGAAVNRQHLQARLLQSNCVPEDFSCSSENLRALLNERFAQIDYKQAKRDVEPFISNSSMLELWSADFFNQITEGLRVC